MTSSAGSSDPDIPYERISLEQVHEEIGLPLPADAFSEDYEKDETLQDKPTQGQSLNQDDSKLQVPLCLAIDNANCMHRSHIRHMENLKTHLQSLLQMWGDNTGVIRLENMVEVWMARMDKIADANVFDIESLLKKFQRQEENAKIETNEVRGQIEIYEKRIRCLSAELEHKNEQIQSLRKERTLLKRWIRTTYKLVLNFGDAYCNDGKMTLRMKHIVESLKDPKNADVINIHRHLLTVLKSNNEIN
ncbi:hypothetical protein FOA43_003370 [Brettanomyces nanus]|uniref:Uncharacterized protein n=1 Tax=Eeniella nana TaxID=13502 RepID=A0A875SAH9_EENNA|nr:uncharacterized protein FOA43_003370 [Brettanomyces nanus]QPG75984.1 hypothetical protein FOA43_003370 [Brettanomyces nanus]